MRPFRSLQARLSSAALLAVAVGCGVHTWRPQVGSFNATVVTASIPLDASAPGFADEAGDGVFSDASKALVRIRMDGTRGALESHPGNPQPPGVVGSLWPLGPHSALADTANGLYIVQGGWSIAPPWTTTLAPGGVVGATNASDGSAWIAHANGLFRLANGQLEELKVGGASVQGLAAVMAARAEDGSPGVWYAHQGGLSVVVSTSKGLAVRSATLPWVSGSNVVALAALGDSATTPGEFLVLADSGLYRDTQKGWRHIDLGAVPGSLAAAGRVAWVTVKGKLLRYDADADVWEQANGLPSTPARVIASDAAGAAWVQGTDGATLLVSRDRIPRVQGLDQNMTVPEGDLVVLPAFPPGSPPAQVVFTVDTGVQVTGSAPDYSLGGDQVDGTPASYSFVGLSEGAHTFKVDVTYQDGTTAERQVPYWFQPLTQAIPSWSKDIQPIFENRCARCHVTGPGPDLSTYDLWKSNASTIVTVLREQRMPADGPLDPQSILTVQRWVQGGMPP